MSDHDRASQGRIARLCGMGKACRNRGQTLVHKLSRSLCGRIKGRRAVSADQLDDNLRRDIGLAADWRLGVNDVRAAFYSKLLERGQPLP